MHQEREPAVVVDGLRKTYGTKVAVEEISLSVAEGEIFGILGPNGAGKTTTVESIAGLRVGDKGRIRVHGIDPWSDREALTKVLGVQLQESKLQPKITVREALELWSAFYPDPEPWPALAERLGLGDHLDQRFEKLSGGQQQRLSIALALVGKPRIVILDELTTGLDPRARREVWKMVENIRDRGVTVLLVTHFMEEAQSLCDRVAIVDRGRVRALDTPAALIDRASAATITTFVPSAPVDLEALRTLPGVASAHSENGTVAIEGAEGTALALMRALADQDVVPGRLRVEAGTLDSAYLDLTEDTTDDTMEKTR
ncbi:ABC-2 type transport system ATP-binding protein [Nocardioides albertanoniae]|uniref:ABC-2 type transport system ATP-binding protein n=1 Tax=Nocardioides albertanoniae TaxID=1175486 RepID=A0A543AAT7_9ACTN|nr:ABC transporter ATP-binding protein [Nocardioides albertanoniae]TQL69630.1 ABC-2 type transport system ATP-binding protein [Nocardioides albertanoniae]